MLAGGDTGPVCSTPGVLDLDLPCLPSVSPSLPHLVQQLVGPAGSLETSGGVKETPAWRRTPVRLAEHRVLAADWAGEPAVPWGGAGCVKQCRELLPRP